MATSDDDIAASILVSVKGASVDELRKHIKSTLPHNVVKSYHLSKAKNRSVHGRIILRPFVKHVHLVMDYALKLRHSKLNDNPIHAQADGNSLVSMEEKIGLSGNGGTENDDDFEGEKRKMDWQNAKMVATKFFEWLHEENNSSQDTSVDLTSVERDQVHRLFERFTKQNNQSSSDTASMPNSGNRKSLRRLESLVMASLRRQKLCRSKRYDDGVVVCCFARQDRTYATPTERKTALDKVIEQRQHMQANKGGVCIPERPLLSPDMEVLPMNQDISVEFPIHVLEDEAQLPLQLIEVHVQGPHATSFQLVTKTPSRVVTGDYLGEDEEDEDYTRSTISSLKVTFRSKGTGVYRAAFRFVFEDSIDQCFMILRSVFLRSGDADMYDILKPTTPYQKKQRKFEKPVDRENVLNPPPQPGSGGDIFKDLKHFKPPLDVRELVENKEMEGALVPPTNDIPEEDFPNVYTSFWQNLLWVNELQAYEDIKLFDMQNARLERHGRFFKLYVAGLAEGRPSVLRGDMVFCNWKGRQYRGRVFAVELLDVLLEFHPSFYKEFNVNLDSVELVRFTFSRTAFRTSHHGCLQAAKTMGPRMLLPLAEDVQSIKEQDSKRKPRSLPPRMAWASLTLNDEQKLAVAEIAKGETRPLPYIIFGPPGTGKTTTVTETIYQLGRLRGQQNSRNDGKLNILLVAPSNDATDILVEKLSPYFPPSEMIRVLAYSRTLDQVSPAARPYVREGLQSGEQLAYEIMSTQIVVSTVNLAARFWCSGVKKGHFDVLCVDEAGHATEPEVIAVASTLMDFASKENPAQMILAGDPMQLGPIITSSLCKKFGMGVSYMERLVKTSPAYTSGNANAGGDELYPPELVTFLVRNYRSHPAILKLPNEMFYHNKLLACGDKFSTHSMAKWEHLPTQKGFPIVFHAVDGENLREGSSPSWYNPQECVEVVNYVNLLVKQSRPAVRIDDIGIITPYARQVQKIRLTLKSKDMGDVKVGSVETFQGQERRCIIISTVRSESEHLSHDLQYNLGFVANEKRFNVAVTRAKALLIIVGNPRVLATDKKNWLPLLRYCRENGAWMGQDWREDEVEDVDENLLREGLSGMNLDGKEPSSEEEWEMLTHPSVAVEQEALGFINREE